VGCGSLRIRLRPGVTILTDWWLIQVHEAIEWRAPVSVVSRHSSITSSTAERDGERGGLDTPLPGPAAIASCLPARARSLSAYDRLVCTALTARHIGLWDGDYRQIEAARPQAPRVPHPQGYRLLKIDRDMVRHNGCSGDRQLMGTVPEDILNGERLAPLRHRAR
jgi:hypothetical protein